jgi:hypothetical protein
MYNEIEKYFLGMQCDACIVISFVAMGVSL